MNRSGTTMPVGSPGSPSSKVPLPLAEHAVQFAGERFPSANFRPGLNLPVLDPTQCENLAACSRREPLPRFAYWLVQQLELPHEFQNGYCRVAIPEDQLPAVGGRPLAAFHLDGPAVGNGRDPAAGGDHADTPPPAETSPSPHEKTEPVRLTADEPFFHWLCSQLRERGPAAHARPCGDLLSVYELVEPLFRHYRIDGGSAHLSGCTLEDRPFMRLTYASGNDSAEVVQLFFTADGIPADVQTRDALGLSDVCIARSPQPYGGGSQVELLIAAGKRCVQNLTSASDSIDFGVVGEPLAATLVWVKRAIGKLQFTIGDASADVAFEGWARTLEAPPFVCPHSGLESYHIAATDDGRIAAAEAIEACAESGRRVLASELVTCSVTGKRVLPQFTQICPVSGLPALTEEFLPCTQCRQPVSRVVLKGGLCEGCRSLARVGSDDPRLVWILSDYPRLEPWKRWRLSETARLYYVVGSRLWTHLLVVFDKETLAPQYAATRVRFRKHWLELDPTEQQEIFAERAMEKPPE